MPPVALQAPTGSNTQGWRWIVVADWELRSRAVGVLALGVPPALGQGRRAGEAGGRGGRQPEPWPGGSAAGSAARVSGVPGAWCWPAVFASEELPAENQAGLWGSLLPAAWSYSSPPAPADWVARGRRCACGMQRRSPSCSALPPWASRRACLHGLFTGETFRPAHRGPLETMLHIDRSWQTDARRQPARPTVGPDLM